MSNQPGIYNDIGKKARDILYRDYIQQPPLHYNYQWFDWSYYLSCRASDLVPGLNSIVRFFIPYQRYNRVEVQWLHDYAGITGGISLAAQPVLKFSAVTGNGLFSIGTNLLFDSATGQLAKCDAGFNFNTSMLVASLTLCDKGDSLTATCYSSVNPLTSTAIAAGLSHRFLRNETTFTIGAQHSPFPCTLVKARLNTQGKIGGTIHQQLFSTFLFTLTGELNINSVRKTAKVGLSLALTPQFTIQQSSINLHLRPVNLCWSSHSTS